MKYWYETLAVAQRILIELFRRKRSLILWSIFPVSILLINGAILQERANLTTAKAFAVEVSPNPFSSNTNFKITGAKMRSGYFHYPTLTERLFIKIKTTTLRKQ